MIRGGDFSMLKVWVGLEARSFLQASIETVSFLTVVIFVNAKSQLNHVRLNDASSQINSRPTSDPALL